MRERGMVVRDTQRAESKIAQIGHYKFSGYSHPLRSYYCNDKNKKVVTTNFREGTSFKELFKLYLMNKQLRLAFSNALERIKDSKEESITHHKDTGRLIPIWVACET